MHVWRNEDPGSSPRMRGKPRASHGTKPRPGLIPAHAGKTFDIQERGIRAAAHPRACGENLMLLVLLAGLLGSSPRMRGKPWARCSFKSPHRLIPAHAGKTELNPLDPGAWRAHPRACGENRERAADLTESEGSSPRMRGKRVCGLGKETARGLIPAHAGKTQSSTPLNRSQSAHPRACGENPWIADSALRSPGSSPRMRGKLIHACQRPADLGLIPAHAGKTLRP